MASYVYKHRYPRWVGEIAQVIEAIQLATQTVGQWLDDDPAPRITVTFPDFDMEDPDLADLERLPARDLGRVLELKVAIGSSYKEQAAWLRIERVSFGGMTLRVTSNDRAAAKGLLGRLMEILHPPEARFTAPVVAAAAGAVWGALLFLIGLQWSRKAADPNSAALVAILIWGAGLGFVAFGGRWLLPTIELLPVGQPSRFRRFRGVVWTLVLGVIASLVAALILALK